MRAIPSDVRCTVTDDPRWPLRLAEARAAWTEFSVDEGRFAAFVDERVAAAGRTLADVDVTSLYLTAGCALGDAAALRAFERCTFAEVDAAYRRLRPARLTLDEARQLVRDRLFWSSTGAPGKIASYDGIGSLRGWLRVVTTRIVLNQIRGVDHALPLDERLFLKLSERGDPEADLIRAEARKAARAALASAVAVLDERERELLRLELLGVGKRELAERQGVTLRTMQRWQAAARARLLEAFQRELSRALAVGDAELGSVIAHAFSQLSLNALHDPATTSTTRDSQSVSQLSSCA
jgi:RNA polymerase sigma-70 factor (ECF subfamily)